MLQTAGSELVAWLTGFLSRIVLLGILLFILWLIAKWRGDA